MKTPANWLALKIGVLFANQSSLAGLESFHESRKSLMEKGFQEVEPPLTACAIDFLIHKL